MKSVAVVNGRELNIYQPRVYDFIIINANIQHRNLLAVYRGRSENLMKFASVENLEIEYSTRAKRGRSSAVGGRYQWNSD